MENDIEYYHRLKATLKTDEEKTELIERIDHLLKDSPKLLFEIYSTEKNYERLLNLARRCLEHSDVFHSIINKIKEEYPQECFDLYKKKINKFLEDARNRDAYRHLAYLLKLMKQIPDTKEKFNRYINHIRTKFKRRHALIDELKNI